MSHKDMLFQLRNEHSEWSEKFFKTLEDNQGKCMAIFYKYCKRSNTKNEYCVDSALIELEREYKASSEHADYMFEEAQ